MTNPNLADRIWAFARPAGWLSVVAALVAPAVAMKFTSEVAWTASDFAYAALLLIGGAALCEAFAWRFRSSAARIVFSLAVVALVATIWGSAIA